MQTPYSVTNTPKASRVAADYGGRATVSTETVDLCKFEADGLALHAFRGPLRIRADPVNPSG